MRRLQHGVAATELVFALPIFIVVFLTLLYYGYAFIVYRVAIEAASAGAQAAVAESPLSENYRASVGNGARKAASRLVADFLNTDISSVENSSSGCIAPQDVPLNAGESRYEYRVIVNFSSCRVLNLLSIKFPGLGSLPPALGNVPVSATVQL